MRTKMFITTMFLMLSFIWAHAQNEVFEKLSDHKGITTVFISKSLLGMMPNMDMGGANIAGLTGKLEQMEIYTADSDKNAVRLIKNEITQLVKSKKYETLMAIKEDGENISFYAHKDGDKFKDLIMYMEEPGECTVIRIMGNFTSSDIQKVIPENKKKK